MPRLGPQRRMVKRQIHQQVSPTTPVARSSSVTPVTPVIPTTSSSAGVPHSAAIPFSTKSIPVAAAAAAAAAPPITPAVTLITSGQHLSITGATMRVASSDTSVNADVRLLGPASGITSCTLSNSGTSLVILRTGDRVASLRAGGVVEVVAVGDTSTWRFVAVPDTPVTLYAL